MIKGIGVFAHAGNGNLGDEALIATVLQNLKKRLPRVEFYGYTIQPNDTEERHKIRSFPIRRLVPKQDRGDDCSRDSISAFNQRYDIVDALKRAIKKIVLFRSVTPAIKYIATLPYKIFMESVFIIQSYNRLSSVKLLIVAGSQQVIDFIEGPSGHPYNIFIWSFLARLRKVKVVFLSVGAGPVRSNLSKQLFHYSLSCAAYRSWRDISSLNFVENVIGIDGDSVFPDLAYSILNDVPDLEEISTSGAPLVGINPVPYSDPVYWPGSNQKIYRKYIKTMAEYASWLLRNGYRVLFYPTQLKLDPPVIGDIRLEMRGMVDAELEKNILDTRINSFSDLTKAIAKTSVVVATRFHGIIVPFVLNKPVLGIAYHRKTFDLMERMGQSDYVIGIKEIELEQMKQKFLLLESNLSAAKNTIRKNAETFRKELDIQYDRIVALLDLPNPQIS